MIIYLAGFFGQTHFAFLYLVLDSKTEEIAHNNDTSEMEKWWSIIQMLFVLFPFLLDKRLTLVND